MPTEKQVYSRLIDLYEKNVFELSSDAILHFFQRVYVVNGNKKYVSMIATGMYLRYVKDFEGLVEKLEKKDFNLSESLKKKKRIGLRQKVRKGYYKNNSANHFFNRLLICLFYIKKFNLHKGSYQDSYEKAIKLLKTINFKKIYVNDEAIVKDSSYLFNSVVFLKLLGIDKDVEGQCIVRLQDIYLDEDFKIKKIVNDYEFQSLIYSLTHIIIAESRFYERMVRSHGWIIKYLMNNLEEIKKRVTFDILSEVAFCLRVTGQKNNYSPQYKALKKDLISMIKFNKLNKNIEYLKKKEHTNSILVLLFGEYTNFVKPANLAKNKLFNNQ